MVDKRDDVAIFITRIKMILTQPKEFFTSLKNEKSMDPAMTHLFVLGLIFIPLAVLVSLLFNDYVYQVLSDVLGVVIPAPRFGPGFTIIIIFLTYFFLIILSFVFSGLLHLWILLFKGRGDYVRTYQLFSYSYTPQLVFGVLPFIGGIIALVYSVFLLVLGTERLHKVPRRTAILMYLIPLGIMLLLIVVWLIFLIFMLRNNPGILTSPYYR